MFLDSFPVTRRQLTPAEVLRTLQLRWAYCIPTPIIEIERYTLVRDWLRAPGEFWPLTVLMELSGEYWADVGDMLNEQFGIDVSANEWNRILKPRLATVGELCDFIARHATCEVIPQVSLIAKPCADAGMFLALRARMQHMTGREDKLHPSSPLPDRPEEVMRLQEALALLAPKNEVLAKRVMTTQAVERWMVGLWVSMTAYFGLAVLSIVLALCFRMQIWSYLTVTSFCLCIVSFFAAFFYTRVHDRWYWPGLHTYRDLVQQLNQSNR